MRFRDWISELVRRPVAVLSWATALLVAGAWAGAQAPLEWVPKVELPEVRVTASWPGASPRAVERYVTAPIERAAGRVAGTAHVESLSEEGQATVVLGVAEDAALGPYAAQVSEQLALLEDALPEDVAPRLTKSLPEALRDEQGFMTVQLVGPQTPGRLRRLAEEQVAPKLRSLTGVADVAVRGGTQRELLVTLQPERLAAHGIPTGAAQRRLREATSDGAFGRLRTGARAVLLMRPAETDVEALRQLALSAPGRRPLVRLADVADVRFGPAPRRSISRIDGEPVITLTVDRAPGSHMIGVADAVRGRLEALRGPLPEGARLLVADDKSEAVRGQLRDLAWRGGLGLALVVLTLLFMLQSVRATAAVLFSVAVALAVALSLLGPLGLTLNLLTIAGLAVVFGLLVDNSVVMVEQLLLQRRRLRARGTAGFALEREAGAAALQAVWLPLLGGTLTTVAVMAPLVYLSGELRALFLPFGALVALTLVASLASAALLVPVLGRFLPESDDEEGRGRIGHRLRRAAGAPYRLAARFPKSTLAALLLLLGTPFWLLPTSLEEPEGGWSTPAARLASLYDAAAGSEVVRDARAVLEPALGGVLRPFVQKTRFGQGWNFDAEPEVSVRLGFPPGTPIGRADSLLQVFERQALASEATRRTLARVFERSASLRVQFHEEALRTAAPYVLREELIQEAVQMAGLDVAVGGLLPQGYFSGSGGGISGLTVAAYGPSYEGLEALAEGFARRLEEASRRVAAVSTNAGRYGRQEPRRVLRFHYGADAQARSGATAGQLAAALRPVLAARFAALYADLEDGPQVPVRIATPGAGEADVARVAERPLLLSDSAQVKLSALTAYAVEETPAQIEREDQQYKRYIRVDFRGPPQMSHDFVSSAAEAMPTPPGYRLEMRQAFFFGEETARALGWVLFGTISLVFLVTASVFESWRLPGVVLLSVPTAAIGVALGFLWTGANFAEGAWIGVVLLVGIAANDAILLTGRYRQLRRRRPHGRPSVLARLALRERLRPMWTTTLTSIVALLPLLVFPEGETFWRGLAVAVTGGLLASTLLIPLATVALLSLPPMSRPKTSR